MSSWNVTTWVVNVMPSSFAIAARRIRLEADHGLVCRRVVVVRRVRDRRPDIYHFRLLDGGWEILEQGSGRTGCQMQLGAGDASIVPAHSRLANAVMKGRFT